MIPGPPPPRPRRPGAPPGPNKTEAKGGPGARCESAVAFLVATPVAGVDIQEWRSKILLVRASGGMTPGLEEKDVRVRARAAGEDDRVDEFLNSVRSGGPSREQPGAAASQSPGQGQGSHPMPRPGRRPGHPQWSGPALPSTARASAIMSSLANRGSAAKPVLWTQLATSEALRGARAGQWPSAAFKALCEDIGGAAGAPCSTLQGFFDLFASWAVLFSASAGEVPLPPAVLQAVPAILPPSASLQQDPANADLLQFRKLLEPCPS